VAIDLSQEREKVSDCIFCKIVEGLIPAKIVGSSAHSIAFADIAPRAPVHFLVVPKAHHSNVSELASSDPEALVDLMQLGSKIAAEQSDGSYRFTFNTGADAGQTVFHAHGHITSRNPKDSSAS
jgi:histidine triad (HIT) family protein